MNAYWNWGKSYNIDPSNEFKNLFIRMVAYNPQQRPTIDEILNDSFMVTRNK